MPPPAIYGEPKIRSTENGSVFLEVVVTGADPAKTKWMLGGKELEQNECYIFSHSDEGGNRKKLTCEIKDFDKPLAGEYKAVFYSADGENSATFNVTAGRLSSAIRCSKAHDLYPLLQISLTERMNAHIHKYIELWKKADGHLSRQNVLQLERAHSCPCATSCSFATYAKTAVWKNVLEEHPATLNAPDFHDKPHIVQRDNGNVIVIKVRAKSHLEMKAEWFKDDKPVKFSDRIKSVVKKDDKDKEGYQFLLEIYGPQKEDEAKYKCVVKNAEGQNQQSLNLVFD